MFRAQESANEGSVRLVAVKVIHLGLSHDEAARLAEELQRLVGLRLDHPAVAAAIAAGLDGSTPYIVFEHAAGEPLESTGVRGSLSREEALDIIDAMAAGIDYCAGRGVHHHRLELRDVIVSSEGPRITGFGVQDALGGAGISAAVPETFGRPGAPSDVSSLAAIAYQLITGRERHDEDPDLGPELQSLFAETLSGSGALRPAKAADFAARLRQAASARSGTRSTPVALPELPPTELTAFSSESEPEERPASAAPHVLGSSEAQARQQPQVFEAAEPQLEEVLDRFADFGAASDPLEIEPGVTGGPVDQNDWREDSAPLFAPAAPPPSRPGVVKISFFIACAALSALAVTYALRPRARPAAERPVSTSGVPSTTVDVAGGRGREAQQPPTPRPAAPRELPPDGHLPPPSPSTPAAGLSAHRAPEQGRVLVRSSPAGASVTVNDEPRGETPVAVRDLAYGSYSIRIARDGYGSVERRVRLTVDRPSASLDVVLRPAAAGREPAASGAGVASASISVESRPSGAQVYVNDRLVGSTPMVVAEVPAGPAAVRLERDGYQTWATTVEVRPGEQVHLGASLDIRR